MYSARYIFLISVLTFLSWDIFGILGYFDGIILLINIGILLFLFIRPLRILLIWAFFGLFSGYLLGSYADSLSMREYQSVISLTAWERKKEITGIVVQKVSIKERTSTYLLKIDTVDKIDIQSTWRPLSYIPYTSSIHSYIFIESPTNLTLASWDTIRFYWTIKSNIKFPLQWYDRFAFMKRWYGSVFVPLFTRVSWGELWFLENMRIRSLKVFRSHFPDDIAGILLGMTIGMTDLLSAELRSDFIWSGLTHILVVSGSNIAFLILLLTFFMKYLDLTRNTQRIIISIILLSYGSLVGWDTSVIRATIMGILSYMIATWWWRWSSKASLGLAMITLIIINPLSPLYDVWFGLSFSATLGILLFHKKIEYFSRKVSLPEWSLPFFSITLWATLGSLPIMVFHFGTIGLWSLVANILIAWILGWILFSSVLFLGVSFFSSTLAYYVWFLIYIPTKYVLEVGRYFWSGMMLTTPEDFRIPITLFLLGIYVVIFLEGVRTRS